MFKYSNSVFSFFTTLSFPSVCNKPSYDRYRILPNSFPDRVRRGIVHLERRWTHSAVGSPGAAGDPISVSVGERFQPSCLIWVGAPNHQSLKTNPGTIRAQILLWNWTLDMIMCELKVGWLNELKGSPDLFHLTAAATRQGWTPSRWFLPGGRAAKPSPSVWRRRSDPSEASARCWNHLFQVETVKLYIYGRTDCSFLADKDLLILVLVYNILFLIWNVAKYSMKVG